MVVHLEICSPVNVSCHLCACPTHQPQFITSGAAADCHSTSHPDLHPFRPSRHHQPQLESTSRIAARLIIILSGYIYKDLHFTFTVLHCGFIRQSYYSSFVYSNRILSSTWLLWSYRLSLWWTLATQTERLIVLLQLKSVLLSRQKTLRAPLNKPQIKANKPRWSVFKVNVSQTKPRITCNQIQAIVGRPKHKNLRFFFRWPSRKSLHAFAQHVIQSHVIELWNREQFCSNNVNCANVLFPSLILFC